MSNLLQVIQRAASLLADGKVVAIPTETVYGLGACARNPEAVQRIYEIKGRPATNPLIIHLPDSAAIADWAIHIPEAAWILAERFWPGPLTLVLERQPDVLESVTAGQSTIALRVPNHPLTLTVLKLFGSGIAAPSANRYGRVSPTTANHVQEDLGAEVDYILDGGPCEIGIESTIVSLAEPEIKILRQGRITQQAIEACLGYRLQAAHHHASFKASSTIRVPGQSVAHYAPLSPLFLYDPNTLLKKVGQCLSENRSIGVLSFEQMSMSLRNLIDNKNKDDIYWIQGDKNSEVYARELYSHLRVLDALKPTYIFVEIPPLKSEWVAVRDRLYRASQKG